MRRYKYWEASRKTHSPQFATSDRTLNCGIKQAIRIGGISAALVAGLGHSANALAQDISQPPLNLAPVPLTISGSKPAALSTPADAKPEKTAEENAKEIAEQADAILKEQDLSRREQLTQEILSRVSQLNPSDLKNDLLRRLTRTLAGQGSHTESRQVALGIDQAAAAERARALILLAKAEAVSNQKQQAWWTLHEAQEIALKLTDEQEIVGVFREIGAVEATLRGNDLSPTSTQIIDTVLQNGLPPKGYHEVDIVRSGGGPLREPMVIKHTYYYNGDRVYQGPNFKGGPTVVQVTHPKTNCPAQVSLNMPSGAPLIEHDDDFIRYHFPNVFVTVRFHSDGCCTVDYGHHLNAYDKLRHKIEKRDLTPAFKSKDDSGTGNAIRNFVENRLGGPLDVAGRLPVMSDVLNRSEKRIPNTLQQRAKTARLPDAIRRK